jgi:RHS repeat-associated protein
MSAFQQRATINLRPDFLPASINTGIIPQPRQFFSSCLSRAYHPDRRAIKTEPLYPPAQGDEADPGFMASLIAFFTKLWSPSTTQAEQLGYAYTYDEQGTLIAEVGSGGTNSAGQSQYIYLPTANGPMPIAAVIDGTTYAVHSDHLNTPRKLSNADGQAVWQWGYSAFGEDKPTIARYRFGNTELTPNPGTTNIAEVKFNLRYPGQYADAESGLFYNGFRTYSPAGGFYTQNDPIGLRGGWNRRIYAGANPLGISDRDGLDWDCYVPGGCVYRPPLFDPDGVPIPAPGISWPQLPNPMSPLDMTVPGRILDICKGLKDWMFSGDGSSPERKIPKPNVGGKEGAKDVPSWAKGQRPNVGESGKDFADRLLGGKYGDSYETGPKSEHNKIRKWGDRAFIDPPKKDEAND